MLIYNFSQYIPSTDTINVLPFPSPRSPLNAVEFIMRMNADVRGYGCVYYLTDKSKEPIK